MKPHVIPQDVKEISTVPLIPLVWYGLPYIHGSTMSSVSSAVAVWYFLDLELCIACLYQRTAGQERHGQLDVLVENRAAVQVCMCIFNLFIVLWCCSFTSASLYNLTHQDNPISTAKCLHPFYEGLISFGYHPRAVSEHWRMMLTAYF